MIETKKIEEILIRMEKLLSNSELLDWVNALSFCHRELLNEPKSAKDKIKSMYGGMGSLNDIVLYKDGQLLISENMEFDELREKLYGLCRE